MNLRITVSLVAAATLAFACGPRTRTDADRTYPVAQQHFALASIAGPALSSAPALRRTSSREKTLKTDSSAPLTTQFALTQRADGIQFDFHVVNASAKRVEIKFPSGQAYDFVVVDSLGREVWRWAAGRIFTQSVQNKLLGHGEGLSIAEKWSPAKTGKYTAIATLHSTNFPLQERVEFERK